MLLALLALCITAVGCGEQVSTGAPQGSVVVEEQGITEPVVVAKPRAAVEVPAASRQQPAATGSRLPARPSSSKARGVRDLSFDDIKFEMEKGTPFLRSMFTPQIEALFGQKIRIRGWILPSTEQRPSSFVLVRDNMECCFGQGAALYDCIIVDMAPGKTVEFTTRPIAVEGKFTFDELLDPAGDHLAIYHLTADKAE